MNHLQKRPHLKIILLLLTFIVAYVIFRGRNFLPLHNILLSMSYLGTFLAGFFYAYGFTAAPATAILLSIAKDQNLIVASLVGGFGALISDIIIFMLIKSTFSYEVKAISKTKLIKFIGKEEKLLFGSFKKYILATFAGFIIASPFPSELGISLMASLKDISFKRFLIIAYILHTIGIFIILNIGNLI